MLQIILVLHSELLQMIFDNYSSLCSVIIISSSCSYQDCGLLLLILSSSELYWKLGV